MRKTFPLLLVVAALARAPLAAAAPVTAPAAPPRIDEYRLKAEFLERFTHFVRWPERDGGKQPAVGGAGDGFRLCVLGTDPFGETLREIARRRKVDDRPIEVRQPRDLREAASCQLLFIAASERGRLDQVLRATRGNGVLTVGDSEGFGARGVIINLFVAEQKIGFEVNQPAARREGFELSSKLLKLARLVDEGAQR